MHKKLTHILAAVTVLSVFSLAAMAQEAPEKKLPATADAGEPFGMLPLVDEIVCGEDDPAHPLVESAPGVSAVEDILGQPCRVLKTEGTPKYFAYIIGKGKNLKAGNAYVLTVEFPEDKARSIFILNRGCETPRGVYTGAAMGDTIFTHTNNNNESLQIPLSGAYRTWQMFFNLHDRYTGIEMYRESKARTMTPADGFHVIIAQADEANVPMSAGAAAWRIRLFEVSDPAKFYAKIKLPPAGLPRRHLFVREEMSDQVISSKKQEERGMDKDADWYEHKARLRKLLGMNTFTTDLLEFGHNQGWDSGDDEKWFNQAGHPKRWEEMLKMLGKYDFDVLPYYEYAGGPGPEGMGSKKLARPLTKEGPYTHITWSERFYADVTDPGTLAEAQKMLDYTIIRHKDKVKFLGAWFRVRPSHIPMSFHDNALARFASQVNDGVAVTREQLIADKALYEKYCGWWFNKRKEFLVGLRDYLRKNGVDGAMILFTADASEPGPSIQGNGVVSDDVEAWKKALAGEKHKDLKVLPFDDVAANDLYLKALTAPHPTWGEWEWQHSLPTADPQRYKDTDGVLLTLPFNRAYTVASPKPFDLYRGPSGLALIYHFPLNENVMNVEKTPILGYFVSDMERSGPYCMLAEARAMANGDPTHIGYLTAASYNRGFPQYVQDFNAAFLALPALPSEVLAGAASSKDVVVRAIKTEGQGTYLAVVNTGLTEAKDVTITLPAAGAVVNAATGEELASSEQAAGGKITVSLRPCQLMSLLIK